MATLRFVASKSRFLHRRFLPAATTAVTSCNANITDQLSPMPVQAMRMQSRCFAEKTRRANPTHRHIQERRQRRANDDHRIDHRSKKTGMRNLHPAAKKKRVISACDYWFSDENLRKDAFLQREMAEYGGYVRISALATFPKLEHWTDAELICDALKDQACRKRYEVVFNRELVEKVAVNRRRRGRRRALKEEEEANSALREKNARWRDAKIQELEELTKRLQLEILERRNMIECGRGEGEQRREEELIKKKSLERWPTTITQEKAARDGVANAKIRTADKKARENEENDLELEALGLVDDRTKIEDEELPSIIKNDGSALSMHALVRHKRVTREYLSTLTKRGEENRELKTVDKGERGDDDSKQELGGNKANAKKEPAEPVKFNNKLKRKNLERYSSCRDVRVVENSAQLATFCQELKESISRYKGETKAIGFDVEYCTLEMDIRNNLPAMLQLASPQTDGPTGLIWLDKFPNHGKDMIGKNEYNDLFSILEDARILKIGPSVSSDVKHLANWWGITESEYISYYFSGMVDLEAEPENVIYKKNLQEMCADVLKRDLPKKKEEDRKKNKKLRKRGLRVKTSHWRRKDLTEEMKKYAADDASCAIDVWLRVQGRSSSGQI